MKKIWEPIEKEEAICRVGAVFGADSMEKIDALPLEQIERIWKYGCYGADLKNAIELSKYNPDILIPLIRNGRIVKTSYIYAKLVNAKLVKK